MNTGRGRMRDYMRLACVAAVALVATASSAGAQSIRDRVDTTVTIGQGGTLSVSIHSGRVNVTGGRGSDVRIQGTADSESFEIRSRSSGVSVSMEHGGHSRRAELDIIVPVGTRVVLEGFSAPFSVRGVKGSANVSTLSGDISVADAEGKVTLESVSGDVQAEGIKGDVRAESVSGGVSLRSIDGDIAAESVSGRITIAGAASSTVRAETVGGSLSYDGTIEPTGSYSFATHSGSLTLAVPANAGATVSLETFSGSVDSDFPVTLESGANRQKGESQLDFRIGDGRSRIVLETFSGNIRIQRGSTRANRE